MYLRRGGGRGVTAIVRQPDTRGYAVPPHCVRVLWEGARTLAEQLYFNQKRSILMYSYLYMYNYNWNTLEKLNELIMD